MEHPQTRSQQSGSQPSSQTNFPTGKSFNRKRNNSGLGKLNLCTAQCTGSISTAAATSTCLFEAQAHTACACEKVYSDRSASLPPLCSHASYRRLVDFASESGWFRVTRLTPLTAQLRSDYLHGCAFGIAAVTSMPQHPATDQPIPHQSAPTTNPHSLAVRT